MNRYLWVFCFALPFFASCNQQSERAGYIDGSNQGRVLNDDDDETRSELPSTVNGVEINKNDGIVKTDELSVIDKQENWQPYRDEIDRIPSIWSKAGNGSPSNENNNDNDPGTVDPTTDNDGQIPDILDQTDTSTTNEPDTEATDDETSADPVGDDGVLHTDPGMFGIAEPLTRLIEDQPTLKQLIEIEGDLGATRQREWVDFSTFLIDENTVNTTALDRLNFVLSTATTNGIEIFAVEDGSYPSFLTGITPSTGQSFPLPPHAETAGSAWQLFLGKYEQAWATLVRAIPPIDHWEIENETNFDLFFYPEGFNLPLYAADPTGDTVRPFDLTTKVKMYADMLYRAHRAIKSVDPDDEVILGGMAFGNGPGIESPSEYIWKLYSEIGRRSGTDPDDYFDALAWHPYIGEAPTKGNFIEPQLLIIEAMESYQDGDKPVYASEMGYSEQHIPGYFTPTPNEIAGYLRTVYDLVIDELPQMKTVFWFRLLDQPELDPREASFGMLTSAGSIPPYDFKPAAVSFKTMTSTANSP